MKKNNETTKKIESTNHTLIKKLLHTQKRSLKIAMTKSIGRLEINVTIHSSKKVLHAEYVI